MDRLPGAVQMMAKAAQDAGLTVNGTASELEVLMKKGQLMSADVLPFFAKRLQEFANANGALESKLNSNRVAMNRLKSSYEIAANEFFSAGWGEGLTELFNDLAKNIQGLNPLLKGFGRIFGSVMRGISTAITLVSAPFKVFGMLLDKVTQLTGRFSAIAVPALNIVAATMLYKLVPALQASTVWLTRLLVPIAPLLGALGLLLVAFDELEASLNPNRLGVFEEFGNYLGSKLFDIVQDAKAKLSELGIWIRQWASDLLAPILEPFNKLKAMLPSMPSLPSASSAMSSDLATKAIQATSNNTTFNIYGVTDPKMVATEVDARMRMWNQ